MKNAIFALYGAVLVAVVLLTVWVIPPALSLGYLVGLVIAIAVAFSARYKALATAVSGVVTAIFTGFALNGALYAENPTNAQLLLGVLSVVLVLEYLLVLSRVADGGWLAKAKVARKRKPQVGGYQPKAGTADDATPPGAE